MPEVREFAHSSASCLASRSGSAIAADSVRCGQPNMPQTGRRNCRCALETSCRRACDPTSGSVTSLLTGSSAVHAHPARHALRTRKHGAPVPEEDTNAPQLHGSPPGHGPPLHSPPSRRPDPRGFARRRPAARALRVARRWLRPPLPPGTDERRGWLSDRCLFPGRPKGLSRVCGNRLWKSPSTDGNEHLACRAWIAARRPGQSGVRASS